MDRFEGSVWPLAAGAFDVFAFAVALKRAPWQFGLIALAIAVSFWALQASVLGGGALGVVAWAFHTGFDVEKTGDLAFSGPFDLARLGVLVGTGVVAAMLGVLVGAARSFGRQGGAGELRKDRPGGQGFAAAWGERAPRAMVASGHSTRESRDG